MPRAVSSVGRASRLHREGRRFEPVTAHQPAAARGRPRLRRASACWRRGGLRSACSASAPAAADPAPMTFRVANCNSTDCGADCPQVIVADGVIEAETPQAFIDFANQAAQSQPCACSFSSIRRAATSRRRWSSAPPSRSWRAAAVVAGFASVGRRSGPVRGVCLSACVYALMGAIERVAPPDSQIGCIGCRLEATGENGGEPSPIAGWLRRSQLRGADGRQSGVGLAGRVADARHAARPFPRRNRSLAARFDPVLTVARHGAAMPHHA